ncbi:DUF6602 domain-containing protein [Rubinisphaera sp.]|uniref:DUF6602 domain-containing protein n=1 Tax=Rubinisphaera sp. TaxID=2024857 RepID=UPI000C0D72B6|nr:DUF6602 domain-containing protein [Rubinisphaera sp.]MBV07992.1 hypothetical protein [Rubinisphaera sp.]HCS50737.1 hypothetical protein [Planctomycetaceae bacterium]|tara:strand:- start:4942 stop:5712 length:771 start_codon:yes stop_codon:yes gene_type:complete
MNADDGPLASQFESALLKVMADFKGTSEFRHAQTKGNEREVPIRNLFQRVLPEPYKAVGAEIFDVKGRRSCQHDVVIFNSHKNPTFVSGKSTILPAEAALVIVEVKSKLNSTEVKKCFKAARTLKELHPFGKPACNSPPANGGKNEGVRYFYTLFAYDSDLRKSNWMNSEYERIDKIRLEEKIDTFPIDRLYVADRGIIMPAQARGCEESDYSGEALMEFLIHSVNFCLREDSRRPPVEYVNYTRSGSNKWKNLKY